LLVLLTITTELVFLVAVCALPAVVLVLALLQLGQVDAPLGAPELSATLLVLQVE
jgi:hypothetical protein